MNAIKNYYFILGVSRGASHTEIEAAYESRKAVAAYDEFQASMMGEVTDAYEHLSDPARRREYDDSLGAPPQLSPTSGNIHNFRSAESGIALEIALSKMRRKQQFKRQIVKDIIMGVIFLGVAGAGIHYGMKFFVKNPPPVTVSADLFRVTKPQPVPESVIPATITAV
ncbi:MAG: J domain-containing protein, partial [Synergistaceae bacterium]|nr:J domain-containing protein [Synergistaceae bacterium]